MAEYHFDDTNIPEEERLFSRIHLVHMVEGDDGQARVSSAAFRDLELSVNIEGLMHAADRNPQDCLKNNPGDLLVSITASECRRQAQLVGPDPLPDDSAHGYAFGKKTGPIKKALRDAARWIVPEQPPSWNEILTLKDRPADKRPGEEPGPFKSGR